MRGTGMAAKLQLRKARTPEKQAGSPEMSTASWPLVPSAPSDAPVPTGPDAPIMDVLRTMRAMRRLKPDPVPRELLEQLIEAATWAPNASASHGYNYIVVTDRAQMTRLGALWRDVASRYITLGELAAPDAVADPAAARVLNAVRHQAENFDQTPAVVAVCYGMPAVPRELGILVAAVRAVGLRFLRRLADPRVTTIMGGAASAFPAAQNLLLAARAHGLAANISTWHLFRERDVKAVLGVPKDVTVYALIPIGWPEGHFGPVQRRPATDVIHWDRW